MPQDKRLIITKAVLQKVQRVAGGVEKAESVGIFVEFIIPPILLQRDPLLTTRIFNVSHPMYPKNGRSTVLIVPKVIALDCSKINKRHGYFDAVVAAEAICRRGDEESEKRAAQVAKTFSHFVVDARIVSKLPHSITAAVAASSDGINGKVLTAVEGMEERESIAFRTAQVAKGGAIRCQSHGQCVFRVGHGGMTAGDIAENAKNLIFAIKQDFPNVWKFVGEFKLSSPVTDKIRFMEANIQK